LKSAYPSAPPVLHSRSKKECSFMKSVKARRLMSVSVENGSRSIAKDLFKSIEINNTSKYASSKRIIFPHEIQTKNKKSKKKINE
jgi:hypothetical protein